MLFLKVQQGSEPFAKVWKATPKDGYALVQFSTSEKWMDKNGETQTKYCNWISKFAGQAFNKYKTYGLNKGDVLQLKTLKFECSSKKEADGTYTNTHYLTVLDFDKYMKPEDLAEEYNDDYDDLP